MGVSMGNGYSLVSLASATGNSTIIEWAHALHDQGVSIDIGPKQIVFLDVDGSYIASAGVKMTAVKLLMEGSLHGGSSVIVTSVLLAAMEKCLQHIGVDPKDKVAFMKEDLYEEMPDTSATVDVMNAASKAITGESMEDTLSKGISAMFSDEDTSFVLDDGVTLAVGAEGPKVKPKAKKKSKKEEVPMSNPVPLNEATEVLQPVKGSDSGSVYHAIALRNDLKVGVRIKSDYNISFRVAGNVEAYADVLKSLKLGDHGSYYSIHIKAPNKPMALKSVGALLMGMGVSFDEVTSNVAVLIGAGA